MKNNLLHVLPNLWYHNMGYDLELIAYLMAIFLKLLTSVIVCMLQPMKSNA